MKTLKNLLLAALVAFSLVSPAAAYFEPSDLIMVAYDSTGPNNGNKLEVAVDANINTNTFDFTQQNYLLGTLDYSAFAGFESKTAVSLFASYLDMSTFTYHNYFATTVAAPAVNLSNIAINNNAAVGVYTYYADAAPTTTGSTADTASFKRKLNGSYGNLLYDTTLGQAPLASILANGYVDMYLQHTSKTGTVPSLSTVGIIRLLADGSVLLNPASVNAVPVPAAVWLLGSGLVGLVGIRRKQKDLI